MKRILSVDFFFLFIIILIWAGSTAFGGNDPTGLLASLRVILGIVIVLFLPGYAIQAAIFPRKSDLDAWTRLVFSFGLSIVLIPLVALLVNASTLGIHFSTMAGGILIVFFAGTVAATIIRRRLPEGEKISMEIKIPPVNMWISENRTNRFLQMIMTIAIGIAGLSAVYMYQHPYVESYTEFYLVNRESSLGGDPRMIIAGDPLIVGIGIINHEGQANQYKIIAMSDDGRTLGEIGPLLLEDGMPWEGDMTITVNGIGENQRIDFILERIGSPWPYRSLRLWINVVEKEEFYSEGTRTPEG
jgi:uncharacterized membrane protein